MQGRMKLMNVISCALVFWFKERWNMEVSTAKKKRKLKMWQIIMISLVAGIAVGLGMSFMGGRDVGWIAAVCDFMSFLGNVFIRLIRMVIVPLVFFSIVSAMAELKDLKRLRSIGIKTILLFTFTTAIALTIGLVWVNIIRPGDGIVLSEAVDTVNVAEMPGIYDTLLNLIPLNVFEAFTNGSMLQITCQPLHTLLLCMYRCFCLWQRSIRSNTSRWLLNPGLLHSVRVHPWPPFLFL